MGEIDEVRIYRLGGDKIKVWIWYLKGKYVPDEQSPSGLRRIDQEYRELSK